MFRTRLRTLVAGLGIVVLLGAVAVLVMRLLPSGPSDEALVTAVTEQFLDAWAAENWDALAAQVVAEKAERAAATHKQLHDELELTATRFTTGSPEITGDGARVPVHVEWTLAELGTHRYDTTVALTRVATESPTQPSDYWRVDWAPSTAHPQLTATGRAERVRLPAGRGTILGADGGVLAESHQDIVIGITPDEAVAPELAVDTLAAVTDARRADVAQLLAGAGHTPQPVARLPRDEFNQVRERLLAVPGLSFSSQAERVRPGPPALSQLLGRVGEVTAEQLETLPEHYDAGDRVGRSGLEQAHETTLAGAPAEQARLVGENGVITVLAAREGDAPQPLQTTLDPAMTEAARAALASVTQPAALVAVDVSSGELRASVSTPLAGFNRALLGRYPPGSTFKTVTAAALLADGMRPDTVVSCPSTVTIYGRTFHNAGDLGPGPISFAEAFRRSCNTAFTQLGVNVGQQALTDTAETFGFNTTLQLGLPATDPSFPPSRDAAGLAAAAIGQAQVISSPAHMASVAAAVAAGQWRPPMIVRGGSVPSRPLPPGVAPTLQKMMRGVVARGTGTAAQRPGVPVAGKTGSAEFGSGPPFDTHAWFIGFRGDVAFATFVQGGGGGGSTAAPIAARFLAELATTTGP